MYFFRLGVKVLVFCILLVLFYLYFFQDVIKKFNEGLTNIAIMEKDATNGIQIPVVSFCLPFKPSTLKKYNITEKFFYNAREENFPEDISMNSLYMEASNVLNQDFELSVILWTEHKLKVGNETINGTNVLVEEIPSPFFGLCYSLTFNAKVSSSTKIATKLRILDSNPDKVKVAQIST